MNKIIKGKAFVLGNNIDTDQIIPAEHLVYSLTDENESKKYGQFALSGVPPTKSGLPIGNIQFIERWKSQIRIQYYYWRFKLWLWFFKGACTICFAKSWC